MSKDKKEEIENYTIKYNTDIKIKTKIDEYLRKIANLECDLGKDSTEKERVKIKVQQDRLLQKIKLIDEEFYFVLVPESER